ncbi:Uu.00g050870.m01.CDS01 [Anthostomella pinea]|uniref:Uu.00g050870.m01.CDS01 n=1 Tax=Anthostomella pinea TaxID=933095 RepID=A0AAI8YMQ4_9PEZI|nr:Uu.00g050870.m01.CDS01 [Anthostomella pinea]
MEPSSASRGFSQRPPVLKNQFHHDPSIQRMLKLFVPRDIAQTATPEMARLGAEVLEPQIFAWITDAERNPPHVSGSGKNAFGSPNSSPNQLVLSEGWRKLQDFGLEKGFAAQGYEFGRDGWDQYTRVVQYLRVLLWEGSCANTTCPSAMADGAARLLLRHLHLENQEDLGSEQRKVFQNAYAHLTSRDPRTAWTSAQWMTERGGGSDVSQTETLATYYPAPAESDAPLYCDPAEDVPLGPWRIDGSKWFSSATDAAMTILLARTPTSPSKGLSAFYAPTRRYNPSLTVSATGRTGGMELNGVSISRLKNKMGTKSLPTAELELRGMRAWLVGEEGQGVKEIATILTITRVRSAISGLGYLSRGLAIARAFAEVREVGAGRGKRVKLTESALHMRTLADMTVEYHAMMLIAFYTCYVMGLEEHPSSSVRGPPSSPALAAVTPPAELVTPLLRVLTPVLKAYCTKRVVPLLHACMESLGGVGVLENSGTEYVNVARLFRDACVLSIWEGTTDVLSTDLVRALKHPKGGRDSIRALDLIIRNGTGAAGSKGENIVHEWERLRKHVEGDTQDDLLGGARGVLWKLAQILMAVMAIVQIKSEDDAVAKAMCERYLVSNGFMRSHEDVVEPRSARKGLELDQAIVFGHSLADDRAAKL